MSFPFFVTRRQILAELEVARAHAEKQRARAHYYEAAAQRLAAEADKLARRPQKRGSDGKFVSAPPVQIIGTSPIRPRDEVVAEVRASRAQRKG